MTLFGVMQPVLHVQSGANDGSGEFTLDTVGLAEGTAGMPGVRYLVPLT